LLKVALNTKTPTNQQTEREVIAYDRFVVYDAFSHLYNCTLFSSDWMTVIVFIGRSRRDRDRMVDGFYIIINVVSG
jgi:hypothetical protein